MRQRQQRSTIDLGALRRYRLVLLEPFFEKGDALEGGVPAGFELAGDQAFGGIDRLISARRQRSLIACFFQLTADRLSDIVVSSGCLFGSLDRRLDGMS